MRPRRFGFDEGDGAMSAPYREAGFVIMTPVLRGENGRPDDFSAFHDEKAGVLNATMAFRTMLGVALGRPRETCPWAAHGQPRRAPSGGSTAA
jgi:hypothetical protein